MIHPLGPYSVRVSLLMKQFLGKGYTGWFAVAFPALDRVGIWNLAMVPIIACLPFMKDTIGSLTSTNFFLRMAACRVAIILLGRNYATDAVPLYQYTGTHFTNLGRMTS